MIQNQVVKRNLKFRPVKSIIVPEIGDVSVQVKKIQEDMISKSTETKYTIFSEIEKKKINSTVKVISKSRIITTNRGSYQICTI